MLCIANEIKSSIYQDVVNVRHRQHIRLELFFIFLNLKISCLYKHLVFNGIQRKMSKNGNRFETQFSITIHIL